MSQPPTNPPHEKQLIIRCTEVQYEQMLEHFRKGAELELTAETGHGIGFSVRGFAGSWWLEASSQAGITDLGDITWEAK